MNQRMSRETELSLTQSSSVVRRRLNICKNYWVGKGKLLVLITLKFLSVFLFVCFFFLSLFLCVAFAGLKFTV